eukprot:m.431500 g.431500  ORF g.431500 m.431500 type:complete len:338 (+) comp17309_c0_seq1:507-1520(+)
MKLKRVADSNRIESIEVLRVNRRVDGSIHVTDQQKMFRISTILAAICVAPVLSQTAPNPNSQSFFCAAIEFQPDFSFLTVLGLGDCETLVNGINTLSPVAQTLNNCAECEPFACGSVSPGSPLLGLESPSCDQLVGALAGVSTTLKCSNNRVVSAECNDDLDEVNTILGDVIAAMQNTPPEPTTTQEPTTTTDEPDEDQLRTTESTDTDSASSSSGKKGQDDDSENRLEADGKGKKKKDKGKRKGKAAAALVGYSSSSSSTAGVTAVVVVGVVALIVGAAIYARGWLRAQVYTHVLGFTDLDAEQTESYPIHESFDAIETPTTNLFAPNRDTIVSMP